MRSIPRLFIDANLSENTEIPLSEGQSHYLLRVMRLGIGAPVCVFNGRDGEWDCKIIEAGKKSVRLDTVKQTRVQVTGSDLWLVFAPLKVKARTNFIVEKAVELGAARLLPMITERTQTDKVRTDKWFALVIEAAEQTERLDVPKVVESAKLDEILEGWDPSRQIIYADESGDDETRPWGGMPGRGAPIADVLQQFGHDKAAIFIGPEGGFSRDERAKLRSLDYVLPVTLGPRILRAETASIAALTIWQSVVGDWT